MNRIFKLSPVTVCMLPSSSHWICFILFLMLATALIMHYAVTCRAVFLSYCLAVVINPRIYATPEEDLLMGYSNVWLRWACHQATSSCVLSLIIFVQILYELCQNVEMLLDVVSIFIFLLEEPHFLSKAVVHYLESSCDMQTFNHNTVFCSI